MWIEISLFPSTSESTGGPMNIILKIPVLNPTYGIFKQIEWILQLLS